MEEAFAAYSRNSQLHQYLSSAIGTLLSTSLDHSVCHCDASTDGLGATLEQEQPDDSIHPIVYISRATLANERNWTPMELEAGCVV